MTDHINNVRQWDLGYTEDITMKSPSQSWSTSLGQETKQFSMACQMNTRLCGTIKLHTKSTPKNLQIHKTKSGMIIGKFY